MLPPFPRLRGWKAGGWHTFFLSLVHALALMRQNARFLVPKPRSGTKPGFLRSERRSASSKIPGRKKRRETEGVRSSSTRARTRFRGQKRPVLLHDRERGAQMVERRASEARNDPNGRHGLQAMCRTHAAPQTPGHTQRPPPGPPPTPRHRPCIAEERGTFASSPAMFADGTAAFASSAAPAATSPAPAATALCQHRTRRGIATLLASHRLRSRFPEEASGAGRIARSHLHSQPYRHDRVLGGTGTPSR